MASSPLPFTVFLTALVNICCATPASASALDEQLKECQQVPEACRWSADGTQLVARSPMGEGKQPREMQQGLPSESSIKSDKEARSTSGSTLNLLFRNYADTQQIDDTLHRHAWIQSMQAHFESLYTPGLLGFGFGVSPFAAVKLDSTGNAGNMSIGRGRTTEVFLGGYTFNVRVKNTTLKYGLQRVSNPVLESRDTRALPPAFHGLSALTQLSDTLSVDAGSFDAVLARGETKQQSLATSYGGINFSRLNYLGGNWNASDEDKLSVYVNQARDVWNQGYLSLTHDFAKVNTLQFTTNASMYYTRNQGASLQGKIDNKAYSLTLNAVHGISTVVLAYQRILGNQYFDFVGESWGDSLGNSAAEDFNAPQEKSLQLRYRINAERLGIPGLSMETWIIRGWDSNSSVEAKNYSAPSAPLYALYRKNGQPIYGSHHEIGVYAKYLVQHGRFKTAKLSIFGLIHRSSAHYPIGSWHELRLNADFPFKVF